MKRIILHWTAGTHNVSETDKKHYHFIVGGDGKVVAGNLPPEANESTSNAYAAHTRSLNTGSIGISVAAMHNAKERPFSAGKYPITEKQLDAFCKLAAQLAEKYDIPITRRTVLTHAEVQPTLGVQQRGKWDIAWIPGMTTAGDPVLVGDAIRKRIEGVAQAPVRPDVEPTPPAQARGRLAALIAALAAIFGGKNR